MSLMKMRGFIYSAFGLYIFPLPVPTRPGTRTFLQVPDPSRPEVKNPYPSDPAQDVSDSPHTERTHANNLCSDVCRPI